MTKKVALITGVTGQDGAYLSKYLLSKNYIVHGIKRRASSLNSQRIDAIYESEHGKNGDFSLHYGDMTDATNILRIIQNTQPDEIYNLAAMSHVAVSFAMPEYAMHTNATGLLHILEAVRILNLAKKTKIYQASTSELYGLVQETPQTERTPFYPRSPYAVGKLAAYWMAVNYREAYDIFVSNGILFNHESPLRGETFVTRKISRAVAKIALGVQDLLRLGNLDARRDFGHAKDYVRAMHLILQAEKADDFVIATGQTTEIREFARLAFAELGISVEFSGSGLAEVGRVANKNDFGLKEGRVVVAVDARYFRPTEVDLLLGDASKAKKILGWAPEYDLKKLVTEMVAADFAVEKAVSRI